jgi:SAM-dependent methyltransferase
MSSWIPALEGVQAKLEAGARVADVGCGHGASTVLMAEAYPRSEFVGFDYHEASIEHARETPFNLVLEARPRGPRTSDPRRTRRPGRRPGARSPASPGACRG